MYYQIGSPTVGMLMFGIMAILVMCLAIVTYKESKNLIMWLLASYFFVMTALCVDCYKGEKELLSPLAHSVYFQKEMSGPAEAIETINRRYNQYTFITSGKVEIIYSHADGEIKGLWFSKGYTGIRYIYPEY